ncbi:DUF6777 domain-containing protein [Gordonia sp. PKS22-38]|uniref:DUF6777 domain-containing protein n=1 Tax=Gordonia prachuapensis TaxID=3115651 RepID=A0ABU7MQZ0_9ACTN|nr:DUF6777 domain-containing protein [Gordonia sp. PKS22-38]
MNVPADRTVPIRVTTWGAAAITAVATVAVAGCTKDLEPESSQVVLQAASSQGDSPWTESVAEPVDMSKVVTLDAKVTGPAGQATAADGTMVGLYGGTADQTACDAPQLTSFLAADPAKAAAWQSVLGVTDISAYIASLRPVVLMRDTLVTDHGYQDGSPTEFDALLQKGTAVFVDTAWVPRVRCASGSPLTPSDVELAEADYTGDQWPEMQEREVVSPPAPHTGSSSAHSSEPVTSSNAPEPPGRPVDESPAGDQDDAEGSPMPGGDEQPPGDGGTDTGGGGPYEVPPEPAQPGVGGEGAGNQGGLPDPQFADDPVVYPDDPVIYPDGTFQ